MAKTKRSHNRLKDLPGDYGRVNSRKPVPIPAEALQEICVMQANLAAMQQQLQAYVTGVRIGMGLTGQYLVEPVKGEFVPIEDPKN